MASFVERGPEGIIYKCPTIVDVPYEDVLTFLFVSPLSEAKEDWVLHADAEIPSRCVTKAQTRPLLKRVAHTLRQRYGIGKDGPNKDVVLTLALGHYMLPVVAYGIFAADGILSASSPAATPAELAYQLKQTETKLLVCTPQLKSIALAGSKQAGLPEDRVLVLGDGEGLVLTEASSGKTVPLSDEQLEWKRITDRKTLEDSILCVFFSSGTTGLPKGVQLSHANLVSEAFLGGWHGRQFWKREDPSHRQRTLAHLPPGHVAGAQGYLINPVHTGMTVYWMPRFDFPKFLEYNRRYRITFFFSVPPVYLLIAKSPAVTDHFDSLDTAVTGAAPMGKEIQDAAMAKLGKGKTMLAQTWGLSETTGSITLLPKGHTDKTGSVSPLLPMCEARIVDEDGKDVEPGEAGEMWVRGPSVFKAYWKNAKATQESFVDGWFCTGDILSFKDGTFYIVDRKKELIKYKGNQVAPAELEALLLSHPKIQDAAVIGVPGEGTELPRAYIVADQSKISAEEVMAWVAKQVASHKRLRGGVIFIDAVPKSPTGKILRKVLRDEAKRQTEAKL